MQAPWSMNQLPREDKEFGRRTFLTGLVAGGVGSSLVLGKQVGATTETDVTCKPSAADSLILYLDLLSEVQFQAVKDKYQVVVGLLKSCQQVFDEIYAQVKVLEAELNQSKLKTQARQIRDLVEAGRANARLMRDYLGISGRVEYASLNALTIVGERVAQTASALLPQGEIVLSAAGAAALKKIIDLVKSYKEDQGKASVAQVDHTEALNTIHKQIARIRELIFGSSQAIADADDTNLVPKREAELRTTAIKSLNDAIAILKQLPAKPEPGVKPAKDTMVTLLEGTQKWISNPPAAGSFGAGHGQLVFVQVAHHAGLASLDESRQRVRGVLNDHCGPGSILRTLYCLCLVIPVWVLFDSPGDRQPLLEDVLDLFPCPRGGSKSALALALAQIRL
jgi:hypothetical protein